MITANMHEAKSRLSELVKAVEENGETVILCRNGKEVAQITRRLQEAPQPIRRLSPNPVLRVAFAPDFDPSEPASNDEWPEDCR